MSIPVSAYYPQTERKSNISSTTATILPACPVMSSDVSMKIIQETCGSVQTTVWHYIEVKRRISSSSSMTPGGLHHYRRITSTLFFSLQMDDCVWGLRKAA